MMSVIRLDKLVQNTGLSLASELVNRTGNVILFILISRLLGASHAGQYSLAFSYTLIATRLTFWGLDQLLIRDSSKDKQELDRLFNNSLLIRGLLAIIAWSALYGLIQHALPHIDGKTRLVVVLLAASTLPETVSNLCESVYISKQRMDLVVLIRVPVAAIKIAGASLALLLGYGLVVVAWVINAASFGGMVANLALVYSRFVGGRPRLDVRFCTRHLRIACPLAASGALYIVNNRLDILILSFFVSEAEIGVYSAAVTAVSGLLLISHAYRIAVFPALARLFATDRRAGSRLYLYSVKYMVILSLPLAVLLPFFGGPISAVFGKEFRSISQVLNIMAWLLPPMFVNVPIARLLVIANSQRIAAGTMAMQLVAKAALCLVLVPEYGALGAAWASLLSAWLMVFVNYVYVSRHIQQTRLHRLPIYVAAAAGMGGTLLLLQPHLFFAPLLGSGVYAGALLLGGAFSETERSRFWDLLHRLVGRVPTQSV